MERITNLRPPRPRFIRGGRTPAHIRVRGRGRVGGTRGCAGGEGRLVAVAGGGERDGEAQGLQRHTHEGEAVKERPTPPWWGTSHTSDVDALVGAKAVEDIDRILREILSDSDSSDPAESDLDAADKSFNVSVLSALEAVAAYTAAVGNFAFGPKISDWDEQRRRWLEQNRGFLATVLGGKPRILVVTGSHPGPCDNSIGDHYLLKTTKNKIDYCRIHGIEIVHNLTHLDTELAGFWAKLSLLRRLMLSYPEVEWIRWMDSDALFTDMAFELPLSRYYNRNLIIHGYQDLLFEKHSWTVLNTGSFLFRNCQWSLDLLDAWAPMGPKGLIHHEAGKILTSFLKGCPAFEDDDQSALIYLLLSQKKWMDKVFIENSFYLHSFWAGLVDKYEDMMDNHHPRLGDERWPFVTHFVGCKPCGSYGDFPVERCLKSMERAFNFTDNQVLRLYGFTHKGLESPKIKRIRSRTTKPINDKENLDMKGKDVDHFLKQLMRVSGNAIAYLLWLSSRFPNGLLQLAEVIIACKDDECLVLPAVTT